MGPVTRSAHTTMPGGKRHMLRFIKKQALYVLSGFIVTFAVYLFLRFDTDKVLIGLLVGLAGGVGVGVVLFFLERRFPDRSGGGNAA